MQHGGFSVGVAAFPDGHPASAGNFQQDVDTLIRKERLGATFATTQFFFDINSYRRLVNELADAGSQLPIIAGVLPVTNVKQLNRMAELNGTPIPRDIAQQFEAVSDDEVAVRDLGIDIASKLCQQLIAEGASGIHFYTMNKAAATAEIVRNIGLR